MTESTQAETSMHDQASVEPTDHSSPSNMIGRQIGPYRLERELGKGGMGTVYLGVRQDDQLRMKASIKLIHLRKAQPEILERFRCERQILADLKHPRIAMLLDAGTSDEGHPYFIMEYIEGHTIDVWNNKHWPALSNLLRMFRSLVEAVGFAHDRGVIHRDIKPHNLMVSHEGEPKLLDFGIARLLGQQDLSAYGQIPMTPAYASPEQSRGETPTAGCDIYALGLVLLELLLGHRLRQLEWTPMTAITKLIASGRPKQPAATPAKVAALDQLTTYFSQESGQPEEDPGENSPAHANHKATNTDSTDDAVIGEPVPESLGHVLRRALAVDPQQRYGETAQLISGLDRVLASLPPEHDSQPTEKVYDGVGLISPAKNRLVGAGSFVYRDCIPKSQTLSTISKTTSDRSSESSALRGAKPSLDAAPDPQTVQSFFTLSWSHYIFLMGVKNIDERGFYEIEAGQKSQGGRPLWGFLLLGASAPGTADICRGDGRRPTRAPRHLRGRPSAGSLNQPPN